LENFLRSGEVRRRGRAGREEVARIQEDRHEENGPRRQDPDAEIERERVEDK
jgi:hypothetical protein